MFESITTYRGKSLICSILNTPGFWLAPPYFRPSHPRFAGRLGIAGPMYHLNWFSSLHFSSSCIETTYWFTWSSGANGIVLHDVLGKELQAGSKIFQVASCQYRKVSRRYIRSCSLMQSSLRIKFLPRRLVLEMSSNWFRQSEQLAEVLPLPTWWPGCLFASRLHHIADPNEDWGFACCDTCLWMSVTFCNQLSTLSESSCVVVSSLTSERSSQVDFLSLTRGAEADCVKSRALFQN